MKSFVAAIAIAITFAASASAQLATYDNATGNLSLDGLGFYIGLDVQDANAELNAGAADVGPPGTVFDPSLAPGTISWLAFGGLPSPSFDLGDVLPAGRAVSETEVPGLAVFTIAGFGAQPVPVEIRAINVIPEPTSLAIAGLAGLGLVARRRR